MKGVIHSAIAGEPELVGKWWRRGAFDDGEIVEVPASSDWRFPWCGGHLTRFEVWACGAVYASEREAEPIVRLATPLSLKPHASRVFHGLTTNDAYRIEWRDAHPNRDAAATADAFVELRRNGDVILSENGMETLLPYEIPFPHDGFGQDDEWICANFADADEILAAGYPDWVDGQVGTGLTNGLYKFTATFPETPPEPVQLVVGDYSVCVTNAGEYVFILKKGVEHRFGTRPHVETVRYSHVDDIPTAGGLLRAAAAWRTAGAWTVGGGDILITPPTALELGLMLWMPTLRGHPDIAHLGPDNSPLALMAILSDIAPGVPVSDFQWTASEPLVLSSMTGGSVELRCDDFPSWSAAGVTVTTRILGRTLTSNLSFTCGVHDTPQTRLTASVPSALLLRDDWAEGSQSAVARFELSSDVETNGTLRVSVLDGAGRVSVAADGLGEHRFGGAKSHGVSFPVDGVEVSASVGDVAFVCEYIDPEGRVAGAATNRLTVVSPKRVSVAGGFRQDVAVLRGTPLLFSVVAEPDASAIPSVSWHDAKRRSDGSHAPWRAWPLPGFETFKAMGEGGVFAIKARASFAGPQWADVFYVWTEDEDPNLGLRRAGDVNHVGVASTQAQLDLRAAARARLGDTNYAYEARLPSRNGFSSSGKNTWKCNAFVADMAVAAGLTVPVLHRGGFAPLFERCYPPLANEWANGIVAIDGWQFLGRDAWPEPGLVVGHPAAVGSGHVGIVDFDGEGIAAGGVEVNRRYKKFLDGTSGFNRYVGAQEGDQDE